MNLTRLWNGLLPFTRAQQIPALDGICSAEVFQKIFERERARADRNSHGFSVVVFLMDPDRNNLRVKRVAHAVCGRMRDTDAAGWFGIQSIAVLLPDTYAAGAKKFADDICRKVASDTQPPDCAIRTYPFDSYQGGGDGSQPPRSGGSYSADPRGQSWDSAPGADFRGTVARAAEHPAEPEAPAVAAALFSEPLPLWKRAIDIVGSSLGLVLLSPLFCLVALFIRIVSPGPVFFRQQRVGYLGQPFTLWKFRTMKVNGDEVIHRDYFSELIKSGDRGRQAMIKLDDPRIIPFGKTIRKLCIDEFPQLINVFRGEMSLVGPRPPIPYEAEEYLRWHQRRFDTVPGMTGLWQVSGKNRLTFNEMVRLDITYARNRSFGLDLRILLKTLPAIVSESFDGLVAKVRKEAGNVEAS